MFFLYLVYMVVPSSYLIKVHDEKLVQETLRYVCVCVRVRVFFFSPLYLIYKYGAL